VGLGISRMLRGVGTARYLPLEVPAMATVGFVLIPVSTLRGDEVMRRDQSRVLLEMSLAMEL